MANTETKQGNMYRNFESVSLDNRYTDENVETFYWIVAEDDPNNAVSGLTFLKKHRPNVATKVAKEYLIAYIDLLNKNK